MLKSIRNIQILIVLLICLGLFSTGFAAWNIADQVKNSVESTGAILVDSTEYISKYIHLADDTPSNKALKFFNFSNGGFINQGQKVEKTGYIEAYFVVNITDCKTKYVGNDSVITEFILKYKDKSLDPSFSIFNNTIITITPTMEMGKGIDGSTQTEFSGLVPVISTPVKTNEAYTFNAKLDNVLTSQVSELHFKVTYSFSFSDLPGFASNVYKHLFNGGKLRSFSLSAKIDGYAKGGSK